ncbi:helix-turn-helix domain-containing protein [Streptomyces sp. NPDC056568]|uniref:helix-turn-helix domain-containing protein n=1 Tax=Streptomyces sp. NPDC056568 TaxID=3345866 RepID=UPI00368FA0B6
MPDASDEDRSPRGLPGIAALLELIDELAEQNAGLELLLSRTARALGRAVGIRPAHGKIRAAALDGTVSEGEPPPGAVTHDLPGVGLLWLAAAGLPPGCADTRLLLRRLAIAAKVALLSHAAPIADDVPLRSVVDARLDPAARAHALHRLGLQETSLIAVFALSAPGDSARMFTEGIRPDASVLLQAPMENLHLVIAKDLTGEVSLGVPVGVRAAFAGPLPASRAPEGWRLARLALRFTRPSPRPHGPYTTDEATLVDGAQLGGYALLAETLTRERIGQVPDVNRLNRLAEEHGEDMLVCLEAVAATESLRKAARLLHRHHNSVAHRVERAERRLGFGVTEPYGRNRLFLALVLRRLQESGHLFPGSPADEPDGAPPAPPAQ